MRLLSKEAVLYTEMVVANAIVRSDRRESLMEAEFPLEDPIVLQLGGSCPDQMREAVSLAVEYGYKQFNINCGCPSDKVAGSGTHHPPPCTVEMEGRGREERREEKDTFIYGSLLTSSLSLSLSISILERTR